jgi:thiamine-monophosphate kinase
MNLGEIGEFGFIDRISRGLVTRPDGIVCGIGDDCAVTHGAGSRLRLLTTDLLIERVHFLLSAITFRQLGAKALAVSLSDIAAMGGTPLDAYVSLAVPGGVAVEQLDELYAGLREMASRFTVNVLGGDTTGSKGDLVINVALTGEVEEEHILYRGGARPGDTLYVSGFLGDSVAGLDAVVNGRASQDATAAELARRHHEPQPHVHEARTIAATGLAHAMIDVSDGLASDLPHVCDRSQVGAEVYEESLPLSPELLAYAARHGLSPHALALSGGEDYVLLLAGDARLREAAGGAGVTLFPIGQVLDAGRRELVRRDGTRVPLARGGWDHFPSDT